MADLDRFVYYACGSINYDIKCADDIPSLYQHIINAVEDYKRISKYYLIAHTETDTLHIHFIFYLNSQTRLMTIFNKLCDYVVYKYHDTRDTNGVNIMKCENINSHMRYILHQDNKSVQQGKQRYEIEDIVSNDDIDIIESIIKSVKGEIDAYYLRDCVLDCNTEFELMNKLGLKVYHKYRYEIQVLKENRMALMLQREQEREEKLDKDLPF